ncbi:MAG: DUF1080 domain-containing protein [Opitutaceae bacterium]|nr:DUF1080 domain-containing protein [Opitutaceae bacterium]
MKLHPPLPLLALALAATALFAPARAADSGFKPIFNGKDLSGWEGLSQFWSVQDGAITGQTKNQADLKANTFLVWKDGQPANFELKLMFKLTPNNDRNQANSGVQYRSKVLDSSSFSVGGYQADIDSTGKYAGMLYEEKGRGIVMGPGEKIRITGTSKDAKGKQKAKVDKLGTPSAPADILAIYKLGEWNELRIVAQGNHVQHFLNGKLTADVTDADAENAPKSGVIALQLHVGPPMTVQFKNVQLKTLP